MLWSLAEKAELEYLKRSYKGSKINCKLNNKNYWHKRDILISIPLNQIHKLCTNQQTIIITITITIITITIISINKYNKGLEKI